MLHEKVKINLNRLDFELKELYSEVKITEKTTHNKFFFQIEAVGKFDSLLESNQSRKVKSLILVEKNNLNFDSVNWLYSVNPSNPNSDFIQRTSKIEELAQDIHSTVTKKQMDVDYLRKTPIAYELINESYNSLEEDTIESQVVKIVEKFNVNIQDMKLEKLNGKKHLKIFHNGIKFSDKIRLESNLNSLEEVSFISFVDDFIKVNLNN